MKSWLVALFVPVGVSLSGCQMLSSQVQVAPVERPVTDSYAQHVLVLNEQMDLYLSQSGREAFLKQILVALESETRPKWKGKDPDTYARWLITVQSAEIEHVEMTTLSNSDVAIAPELKLVDVPYRAKSAVKIHSAPNGGGQVIDTLERGEVFNVIAQTKAQPWLLVGQKGVVRGYVHRDYARANIEQRDIVSTPPHAMQVSAAPGLINEEFIRRHWLGQHRCRQLSYQLSKDGDRTPGQFRACRKQRKIWYIDVSAPGSTSS
ncbi:SH3 domain-containing protein [Vibrio sp. CAU 1672]|uniref:SH3 domain-containing protein n=1 Tax=Vibrio sp. CAU 1672 TaxID=3032594 RepID=UPI0023D9B70C|nr:SH3 domain-containing protein [Vibrio sp. CAU 1672]MDF2153242.1 SH3 domain-containing protein [Vibrio sp. CAU 1672]